MQDLRRIAKIGRCKGFTLLELTIVICVVAVLAAVLLDRIRFYQRMAEKTAVEQMAGTLQSALNLRFTSLIAKDKVNTAWEMENQNPILWLVHKPANYAGEYFGTPDDVDSGQWYFNLKSRELVYIVRNRGDYFQKEDAPHLRFKAKVVSGSEDFPGKNGSIAGKTVEGVVLEQIVPYAWD